VSIFWLTPASRRSSASSSGWHEIRKADYITPGQFGIPNRRRKSLINCCLQDLRQKTYYSNA
jgi:hypothetical protein